MLSFSCVALFSISLPQVLFQVPLTLLRSPTLSEETGDAYHHICLQAALEEKLSLSKLQLCLVVYAARLTSILLCPSQWQSANSNIVAYELTFARCRNVIHS